MKVTDKQISNPSDNTDLFGNLLATLTYQLAKYPRDNEPLGESAIMLRYITELLYQLMYLYKNFTH